MKTPNSDKDEQMSSKQTDTTRSQNRQAVNADEATAGAGDGNEHSHDHTGTHAEGQYSHQSTKPTLYPGNEGADQHT